MKHINENSATKKKYGQFYNPNYNYDFYLFIKNQTNEKKHNQIKEKNNKEAE